MTMNGRQLRAEFEAWATSQWFVLQRTVHGEDYQDLRTQGAWEAYQAGRDALQSQYPEEVMEMALCESRRLVLRIGQAYRFVPMEGCKTCEEMKAEHDKVYAIDRASRVEGEGE